jgi:hypothetical protein
MSIRFLSTVAAVGAVLWMSLAPSLAANEFVLSHRSELVTVNTIRGEKGLVIDAGIAESAGKGPYAKYFVGETDVSRDVINMPAQAELFVYFVGQGGEKSCRLNAFMMQIGRLVGFEHRAFADGPAPCAGIAAGVGSADLLRPLVDLSEGYARRIVLIVSAPGAPRPSMPNMVWRSKVVDGDKLRPGSGFPEEFSQFLRSAARGRLNLIPLEVYADAGAPVTMVVGTANGELARLSLLDPPLSSLLAANGQWIAAALGVAVVIVVGGVAIIRRRRRVTKVIVRSISIGYGPNFDVDLGAAETPREALTILFDDQGSMTAKQASRRDDVRINGEPLRGRRPLTASDRIKINGRNIRFQDETA